MCQQPGVNFRFVFVDVEPSAENSAIVEGRCQRRFFDHGATGGIYEYGIAFHVRKLSLREEATSFGSKRNTHHHSIGQCKALLK